VPCHAHDLVLAVGHRHLPHHEGQRPGASALLVDVGDPAPAQVGLARADRLVVLELLLAVQDAPDVHPEVGQHRAGVGLLVPERGDEGGRRDDVAPLRGPPDRVVQVERRGIPDRARELLDLAPLDRDGERGVLLALDARVDLDGHGSSSTATAAPGQRRDRTAATYTCRMPVLLAALGALLMSLDSAINIALPAMAGSFGVGAPAIRWVIICYVSTYALTAFAAGLLADRLGPRPVYGTAPALVTLSLPREFHGRGLGTMGLGLGIGLGSGPLIGDLLLQRFGWSATFLFRAPLFVAVAVLAHVGLGAVGAGAATPRRVTLSDLVRLPVLRAAAMAFLSNHAQFTVWLLMPFFLVGPLGLSASLGGLIFALTPLGSAVAAPLGGRATDRVGAYGPLVGGLILEFAGLLAIAHTTTTTPLLLVGAGMALVGLGVGFFQVPNLAQMMAAFPTAQQGVAGGLAFLSRTLGSAVGVQVSAALFDARLARDGFIPAFHAAFLAAGLVCALAIVVALLPGRTR